MSLQKHGLVLYCEQCKHVASAGCGFDITVPIRADQTVGTARLRCTVDADRHRVEFVAWDEAPQPPEAADAVRRQVSEVLDFIAEQRLCGNERLCPLQVTQLVEQHTAAATRGNRRPRSG